MKALAVVPVRNDAGFGVVELDDNVPTASFPRQILTDNGEALLATVQPSARDAAVCAAPSMSAAKLPSAPKQRSKSFEPLSHQFESVAATRLTEIWTDASDMLQPLR